MAWNRLWCKKPRLRIGVCICAKKTLNWWITCGQVSVTERLWRGDTRSYERLLPVEIGVSPRGCSRRRQRVLSDFGLEHSFAHSVERLNEHYGFELSRSVVARVTHKHAQAIASRQSQGVHVLPARGNQQIVAEADGSFLRIVSTTAALDRRKTRQVHYQEARLCAAQAKGSTRTCYEATFKEVDQVSELWAGSAKSAGMGLQSKIHVVSDGAVWIRQQAANTFGQQGRFLIDFYHVCEYLGEASESISKQPSRWMKTQKRRLKAGRARVVIKELQKHLEPASSPEATAPVRKAFRYLSNRQDALAYREALKDGLPIGSGLIESGHKHVLQARMKLPGAAWHIDNAEAFVRARAFRANKL